MRTPTKCWMGTSAILLLLISLPTAANSQSFTPTPGSMLVPRDGHTATRLADGKVLIVGGEDADGTLLNSAELYDPTTGTFAATGSMGAARFAHAATLLADGRVLITGGSGSSGLLASAEVYDPAFPGAFSPVGDMNMPRFAHTATLLQDGTVLIVGGGSPAPEDDAELFDPTLGAFSLSDNLADARMMHTATLLSDGTVLVAGGTGLSGPLTSAELFAGGSFSPTGSMATARSGHTATLAGGMVLLTGGAASAGAESYAAGVFSPAGSMVTAPRFSHTATLLNDGSTLVAGGVDESFNAIADAELHAGGSFSATGSMGEPRGFHTATLLNDGKVLVAGGIGLSFAATATAELYSPGHAGEDEEEIAIDIKPGSEENPINPKSKGTIPVAILSSETFDASTEVDLATLTFGRTGDEPSLSHCGIGNIDADGLMDLMCHFYTQLTGLQAGDTEGILKFYTLDGELYVGSDNVTIVPR